MDSELTPSAVQLAQVMAQSTAPAFVLGAVAGFVAILQGRVTAVMDRVRNLNDIPDGDRVRAHLKEDIPRLRHRALLLNSAMQLSLASGICTSLLLLLGFVSAFLRFQHVYGAGVLFSVAIALLGLALFKFRQEVRIGLAEADHYR
jgi:hypothetical protein